MIPTLSFALALAAQQTISSHPQDTPLDGSANVAPFGVLASGAAAESRVQILIPRDELPAPGATLTGLELACLVGGTVRYGQLQITARPVTLTTLSTTFAANLAGPATQVLAASSLQVNWATSAWTPLAFTQPYVHDGVSALLLDIVKVVVPAGGGSSFPFVTMSAAYPERTDRPQMVYVFGGPGSGAATLATAFAQAQPVSMRLRWSSAPTLRHRSDNNALLAYGLGNVVQFFVNATPGHLFALAGGDAFLPAAVPVPGILGNLRLGAPILFASGLIIGVGAGGTKFTMSNVLSLVGLHLAYQAATIDPATGSLSLTNGTDHFINP